MKPNGGRLNESMAELLSFVRLKVKGGVVVRLGWVFVPDEMRWWGVEIECGNWFGDWGLVQRTYWEVRVDVRERVPGLGMMSHPPLSPMRCQRMLTENAAGFVCGQNVVLEGFDREEAFCRVIAAFFHLRFPQTLPSSTSAPKGPIHLTCHYLSGPSCIHPSVTTTSCYCRLSVRHVRHELERRLRG